MCRSLTGEGNRRTLSRLSEIVDMTVGEIDSGTEVYDWEVPPEWSINEAYIREVGGDRVVDFADSNLHVLNYSAPVDRTVDYDELSEHVYTLPDQPEKIPYRTSYYDRQWGFCLRHDTLTQLDEDSQYEVYVDSAFDPNGSMTYADAHTEGSSSKEYVISTYCCHPSLANDNLSGLVLSTLLFERLQRRPTYHSYRLIVVPETIGAIAHLHEHEAEMKQADGGYVVTSVAGPGSFDYKESFRGNHPVDTAARLALDDDEYDEHEFEPTGSDERQYSSPGFRIPTGTISKDKYYEYDSYHTSGDDLSFVSPQALAETLGRYWTAIQYLEMNRTYRRTELHCEFKLDRHDLHPTTGGQQNQPAYVDEDHVTTNYVLDDNDTKSGEVLDAINWLMFGCDGTTTIFDLAERSGMSIPALHEGARELVEAGLLTEVAQ
jgi:aminopeptidase-like protein